MNLWHINDRGTRLTGPAMTCVERYVPHLQRISAGPDSHRI